MTVNHLGRWAMCCCPDQAPGQGLAVVSSVSSWIPIPVFKSLALHTMAVDIMRPWSVSCISEYSFVQTLHHL